MQQLAFAVKVADTENTDIAHAHHSKLCSNSQPQRIIVTEGLKTGAYAGG
jgi:hypothetical protein